MSMIFANDIGEIVNGKRYVTCKKSISEHGFIKGKKYVLGGIFGDPQASAESGEIYMSSKFFNILMVHYLSSKTPLISDYTFYWKGGVEKTRTLSDSIFLGYFQDYFYINNIEVRKEKIDYLSK